MSWDKEYEEWLENQKYKLKGKYKDSWEWFLDKRRRRGKNGKRRTKTKS